MKKEICFALCTVLLAAPATARALDWEVKDVTHTVTATVGENSFTVDGEEILLPEGWKVYTKDGRVMLPLLEIAKVIDWNASISRTKDRAELYMNHGGPVTMDTKTSAFVYGNRRNGDYIEQPGKMELRDKEVFVSLQALQSILGLYGYTAAGDDIRWDSGTRTASICLSGKELKIEGREKKPEPKGTGTQPVYTMQLTQGYRTIENIGGGYFEVAGREGNTYLLDTEGNRLQTYTEAVFIRNLGEGCFEASSVGKMWRQIVKINGETAFALPNSWDIGEFSEGLATVREKKRDKEQWGFVDSTGTRLKTPVLYDAEPFSEGLAAVCIEKGKKEKWGFIDKQGKMAIKAAFEYADSFQEGLAHVIRDDRHGFIDKDGQEVIPPQYLHATGFQNGKAFVTEYGSEGPQTWVIDKAGEKLWLVGQGAILPYKENASFLQRQEVIEMPCGETVCLDIFYDAYGELSAENEVWLENNPSEELAVLRDEKTYKVGYVDRELNWVIAPSFGYLGHFKDGYAVVGEYRNDGTIEYGIIKKP